MAQWHIHKNHDNLEELGSQWHNMLAHQLSVLPPLESFWIDLEPFFQWVEGSLIEEQLVSPSDLDGEVFQPDRISSAYSINSVIHKIQFAAANRVCIELLYHNKILVQSV